MRFLINYPFGVRDRDNVCVCKNRVNLELYKDGQQLDRGSWVYQDVTFWLN